MSDKISQGPIETGSDRFEIALGLIEIKKQISLGLCGTHLD